MIYKQALSVANQFVDILSPACLRIETVGSVKRADKPDVHDIEILMILRDGRPRPVFGCRETFATYLDQILARLLATRVLREPTRKANGPRYKKFAIVSHSQLNEFCLDLFIVTRETWGVQNVIRTGPSLFSASFVVNQNRTFYHKESGKMYKGLLPDDLQYVKGETKIMRGETVLALPEERDAIALLGRGWIEPMDRQKYIRAA